MRGERTSQQQEQQRGELETLLTLHCCTQHTACTTATESYHVNAYKKQKTGLGQTDGRTDRWAAPYSGELRLSPSVVRSMPGARATRLMSVSAARMNVRRPTIPNWSTTIPAGMLEIVPTTPAHSLNTRCTGRRTGGQADRWTGGVIPGPIMTYLSLFWL